MQRKLILKHKNNNYDVIFFDDSNENFQLRKHIIKHLAVSNEFNFFKELNKKKLVEFKKFLNESYCSIYIKLSDNKLLKNNKICNRCKNLKECDKKINYLKDFYFERCKDMIDKENEYFDKHKHGYRHAHFNPRKNKTQVVMLDDIGIISYYIRYFNKELILQSLYVVNYMNSYKNIGRKNKLSSKIINKILLKINRTSIKGSIELCSEKNWM